MKKKYTAKLLAEKIGQIGIEPLESAIDADELEAPTHVDDFIDDVGQTNDEVYASWCLFLFRLPAMLRLKFNYIIKEYTLYCSYDGTRYRVTGASRMGDIWLTTNFSQDTGYELRVDVAKCTDWRKGYMI